MGAGGLLGVEAHFGIFIHGERHVQAPKLIIGHTWFVFCLFLCIFILQGSDYERHCLLVDGLLWAFLAYLLGLVTSIFVYRVSDFHRLTAKGFPGPFGVRVSKLWHVWAYRHSRNYEVLDRLHRKYGDFVRTVLVSLADDLLPNAEGGRRTGKNGAWIAGRFIPPETTIVAPRYIISRREDYFVRAHEFIPERWITSPDMVLIASASVPFGMGASSCLGRDLATEVIKYIIVRLVRKYTFFVPPGEDASGVTCEHYSDIMAEDSGAFDIIIVGGGTAGLVLASRLSEGPSFQVLILEAGLDLPQMPEYLIQAILTPAAYTQLYKSPVDWDLKTTPQLAYADDYMGDWLKAWADAIESLGFPGAQDTLTGQAAGGRILIPRSPRAHQYKYYIGIEVANMLLKKNKYDNLDGVALATDIKYTNLMTGLNTTVIAHREVIVAAGAIGSPKILELSGVNDVQRLDKEQIIVGLPGVEHYISIFASSSMTSAARLPLPRLNTPEGSKELKDLLSATYLNSHGAFASAHENFIRNILASRSEASGYYIFGPAYAAYNPDRTRALPPMDGSEDGYIRVGLLLAHPLSRGSVHIEGAGPDKKLAIDLGYLSHPLDLEVMARHVHRSCSMLLREMGGVVDPLLRVYGTKNLRICDASIIPLTPRANPQASVYGVAEHGAKLIKSSLFARKEKLLS
ncbi:L-sorbose 1-dehydrogenase [Paramyrothecium foliicola]|nr:L-sorbose 1-dehydrogenase [Paramyrothecium foliicola]